MNTHIVYSKDKNKVIYFSGHITTDDGIELDWADCREHATELNSADAWDVLRLAKYYYGNTVIVEVERIKTLEEIQAWLDRPSVAL